MPEGYFIRFCIRFLKKRFFENYRSVMTAVATNISAELLYVCVQCLVISLEYLK